MLSHVEELSVSRPLLRAPKEHGQILAVPPLDQIEKVFFESKRKPGSYPFDAASKADARAEILAASAAYHRAAGETVPDGGFTFVAGHQPELFHPGVWFKNFAMHQLARKHGGGSLNLIIDTDSAKPAILHAPNEGKLAKIAFDRSTAEVPYEERAVEDESLFADLPQRMAAITSKWNFEPMLPTFWQEVMKQVKRTPLLGERFSAARRAMERRWGVAQREVPMSWVCQTEAFARFALWILGDLRKFHEAYNRVLKDYRRKYRMRSHSHPVPDLATDGDWLEAPFWAWRHGQTRRSRLFVRPTATAWDLRVAGETWPSVRSVDGWRGLEAQGFKIRSRALTTTMFVRLQLADVFIHGIGGAIYDELTDEIVPGIPPYLVLSATLLLPLTRFPEAAQQARDIERRLRDLQYNPERFIEPTAEIEALVAAKSAWITGPQTTHEQRVDRFNAVRILNARLVEFAAPHREQAQSRLERCQQQADWNAVAGRRDYAFCLYPEDMLQNFFI